MSPLVALHNYLVIGAVLFALGMIGFLARRNLITMFLCAEMMLQGVALNLVAFARYLGSLQGQVFVLFLITVAACEAGLALVLFLALYRARHSLDVSLWQELRERGLERAVDELPLSPPPQELALPRLPATGHEPVHPEESSHV
jgi:NADH-quinone oxidoreductase subunit K